MAQLLLVKESMHLLFSKYRSLSKQSCPSGRGLTEFIDKRKKGPPKLPVRFPYTEKSSMPYPEISFIITMYREGPLISKTIASILAQTLSL